jgi:hypothetical protein
LVHRSLRLPEQGVFLVPQCDNFVGLQFCYRVTSALDMGEQWDRQREHQRGGVADFAGILERAIGVCERGLGIAKRPQSYRSMG